MKYSIINIVVIVIIIAIILFLIPSPRLNKYLEKEAFTPGLRQLYRPHMRRFRLYTTNTYNTLLHRTNIFLARNGIL